MILAPIQDLKIMLNRTTDTDNLLLEQIIEGVSLSFESWLNRKLEKTARTAYFNGGRRKYYVDAIPIDLAQPLTVTISGTSTTVDIDYFVWEDEGLIEFRLDTLPNNPKAIKIVWTGGFTKNADDSLQIPADLKQAFLLQCAHDYQRKNKVGVSSTTLPDGSIRKERNNEPVLQIQKIIRNYRLPPIVR